MAQRQKTGLSAPRSKMTDIHVLGPGAIGSLFACHFQKANFNTALISRSPSEDARIITLEEAGKLESHAFIVDKSDAPIDRLLVTVKAHQTEAALLAIQERIHANSQILLLQNGMGSWQWLEKLFPNNPYLVATTTEGAYRAQDHHIVHAGRGETWIGSLQSNLDDAEKLVDQWSGLGLKIRFDANIKARLWQKLAINCAINPLTVIYDCKNGDLLKIPNALADMEAICQEVEIVLATVSPETASHSVFEVAQAVAEKTGNNVSSMLQDYRQGKPTEIEFITGYLVAQADKAGVNAARNKQVLETIRSMSF